MSQEELKQYLVDRSIARHHNNLANVIEAKLQVARIEENLPLAKQLAFMKRRHKAASRIRRPTT